MSRTYFDLNSAHLLNFKLLSRSFAFVLLITLHILCTNAALKLVFPFMHFVHVASNQLNLRKLYKTRAEPWTLKHLQVCRMCRLYWLLNLLKAIKFHLTLRPVKIKISFSSSGFYRFYRFMHLTYFEWLYLPLLQWIKINTRISATC